MALDERRLVGQTELQVRMHSQTQSACAPLCRCFGHAAFIVSTFAGIVPDCGAPESSDVCYTQSGATNSGRSGSAGMAVLY